METSRDECGILKDSMGREGCNNLKDYYQINNTLNNYKSEFNWVLFFTLIILTIPLYLKV